MVNSNQNYKIIFTENVSEIISDFLKKYGLEKTEEKLLEKISQVEDLEEKKEIFENLPGRIIAKTAKEIAEKKISLEDSLLIFQNRLNLSEEVAKNLSQELKEKVLPLYYKAPKEIEIPSIWEKPSPPAPGIKPPPLSLPEEKPPFLKEKPKPSPPKKRDIYREPIE
jgi:hypothetical protein